MLAVFLTLDYYNPDMSAVKLDQEVLGELVKYDPPPPKFFFPIIIYRLLLSHLLMPGIEPSYTVKRPKC